MSTGAPRDGVQERLPLLPLKNVVVFPRNVVTLLVGRPRSVRAVEQALAGDGHLIVTAHREIEIDEPGPDALHQVGTLVAIVSSERQAAGNVQVVLEGVCRVRISDFISNPGYYTVQTELLEEPDAPESEARALIAHVQNLANRYGDARGALPVEVQDMVQRASDPSHLADLLATQLLTDVARRQALLEICDPLRRLESVAVHLAAEIDVAVLERRIKDRVRDQIDRNQREYYLREQLKAIHDELGGENGNEFDTLRARVAQRGMPAAAADRVIKEVSRLERMPGVSAEATVVRTYLDTVLALPWHERSEDQLDLIEAERLLDAEHFGLKAVKERILDFLAVRKLTAETGSMATQILCLVGPPGVGKTSLGRSIAEAMGRNFVRVSLGGVRDEAEIRGHRRTYIGSMPGRVISAMKQAGTVNPVVLLDEIDKLSSDYRGDPASAMLEVLDPEQNSAFNDHYLEVDYDLSNVMFITTANSLRMAQPLMDRMEIIRLAGYTEDEKVAIARKHLIVKQIEANGLKEGELDIGDDAVRDLVRYYTREAGVRNLEREIANLARKATKEILMKGTSKVKIRAKNLDKYAGVRRFRFGEAELEDLVGITTGLAWTEVGGELLQIEAVLVPGRGRMTVTGKLGDVMQESVQAANAYVRSRANSFGIKAVMFEKRDIHIHVPEGATPKDGPSAGVGMVTSIVSALTGVAVRKEVAMTGEISLRGRVMPIGGLKEKLLAALRGGLKTVLIPKDNERDLPEIPDNVKKGLEIVPVSTVDEVLARALVKPLVAIEWQNDLEVAAAKPAESPEVRAH